MQLTYSDLNAWIMGWMCHTFNLLLRKNFIESRNEEDKEWIQEEAQKLLRASSQSLKSPMKVYRGTCSKFAREDAFKDTGLMSFSKDIEVAKRFAKLRAQEQNHEPVIIEAVVTHGLDVDSFFEDNYSDFDHNTQKEVIIAPSRFIVKTTRIEDGIKIATCNVYKLELTNHAN